MKRILPLILGFVLLALLSSCGQSTTYKITQTSADAKAELEISPYPPRAMEPVEMILSLKDSQGNSLVVENVEFDLTMPAMDMPENKPQSSFEGDGLYRVQALFTMAGDWRIRVSFDYAGETTTLDFDLSVK
ncbi:MAG: FixH family protein [Anaerolineales bacterium]